MARRMYRDVVYGLKRIREDADLHLERRAGTWGPLRRDRSRSRHASVRLMYADPTTLLGRIIKLNLFKPQPLQQTPDRRSRILLSIPQNAVGHGGLLQLALCLLTHLRFQIRIGWDQQSGLAGIDASLRAVDPCAENLRRRKSQTHLLAIHRDIARL